MSATRQREVTARRKTAKPKATVPTVPAANGNQIKSIEAAAKTQAIMAATAHLPRILRLPAVEALSGMKNTALFNMEQRGEFPKRFAIGKRSTGWLESAVVEWVTRKAEEARPLKQTRNAPPDRTRKSAVSHA